MTIQKKVAISCNNLAYSEQRRKEKPLSIKLGELGVGKAVWCAFELSNLEIRT
jgi:hypothetical protein